MKPIKFPKPPVGNWFNAADPKDVVALYPLDKAHFDVNPAVSEYREVDNPTENKHGATGYLSDKTVAKRVYDGLT